MGTNNVIYLAERVPSYRRLRGLPAGPAAEPAGGPEPTAQATSGGVWSSMARQRAMQRQAPSPHALLADAARQPVPFDAARQPVPFDTARQPVPLLRVTRWAEEAAPGLARARVRISGRLIDVCAELERLAAAEAA